MGGKTNILDPKQLQSLYLVSRRFEQKASASMLLIKNQISKLNDPSFQSQLSGEHGNAAKDAVSNVSNCIEALKQTLESTSKFIDGKLAGAAQLAQEELSFKAANGKAKGIPNHSNLKK